MSKNRVGYVILHYQTVNETLECIESIKKICDEEDAIIVVDNGSPNETGKKLDEIYSKDLQVEVILCKENLGFAKGNNVGFLLAKQKYQCDYIVMLNNDTLVLQKDFKERIVEAYEQYQFGVMGPKVLQRDGTVSCCNPTVPVHTTLFRARVGQISNHVRYMLSIFNWDIKFSQLVDKQSIDEKYSQEFHEDVQLAGCCWIFSKEYISRYDGINPDTFMYLEEILLYLRVKNAGLKTIYNPELEVVHLEEVATREVLKGKTKKVRRFKYRCHMRAFKVLIKELK